MAITSRRKRPLDRTIPCYRDAKIIVIAAEGEKTERKYFESPIFRSTRVQVMVLETKEGHSAPKHVHRRLLEFARKTQLQTDDELWLVLDRDRWPEKQLAEVCAEALKVGKNSAQLAVSNPCFELWLYLHHSPWANGEISALRRFKWVESISHQT